MKPDLPKNPMTITPVTLGRSLTVALATAKYVPPLSAVQVTEVGEVLQDLRDMDNYERSTDPQREKLKAFLLETIKYKKAAT